MAIALVAHTKLVGQTVAAGGNVTTPAIDTTGANFIYLYYTFNNGGSYPILTDSYGNTYTPTARHNAFNFALACEEQFTNTATVGNSHSWTITPWSFYDPLPLESMSLYISAWSGVQTGNVTGFAPPWYNDGGNQIEAASSLACNPGSSGGTNGQLIIMGWGNTDPSNDTTITATDGLGGTPSFTILDHDRAVSPSVINYNAGVAYYIQPTATSTEVTQTWLDWVDLYPHDGPLGQAVMAAAVFLPTGAPAPPTPGAGNRTWMGEMGPVRVYTPFVAPPYPAKGVHFDDTAWLARSSFVNTDSSDFSFFCWFNASSTGTQVVMLSNPSVFRTFVEIHPAAGTTQIFVGLSDSTGTNTFSGSASPALTTDTDWHWLLVSGNMNHAAGLKKFKLFVDGVDLTHVNSDTHPAFQVALNGLPLYVCSDGTDLSPGDGAIIDLASVWMANTNLIDGTGTIPAATRNLFVAANGDPQNPAFFPSGSNPPVLLFDGNRTSFGTNQGTGGAFTLTGNLTNSSTNPP